MFEYIINAFVVKGSDDDFPFGLVGKVKALEVSESKRVVIRMIVDDCRHADVTIRILVRNEVAEVVQIWVNWQRLMAAVKEVLAA